MLSAIEYERGLSIKYSYCELLQTDAYDTQNKKKLIILIWSLME